MRLFIEYFKTFKILCISNKPYFIRLQKNTIKLEPLCFYTKKKTKHIYVKTSLISKY